MNQEQWSYSSFILSSLTPLALPISIEWDFQRYAERIVMHQLTDKVCLVTGGGSGIGLAVARAFLQEGARVAIAGRNEAKLRQAAENLAGGERLRYYVLDVAQADDVQ